ncbi:hypothetical protein B0G81_3938 [Paraburkholderia sp. BL6665CI2N2]|nr:hypothetical protein B0G81_3938 [Paraburkholderia sp. BL6665CI2N2]
MSTANVFALQRATRFLRGVRKRARSCHCAPHLIGVVSGLQGGILCRVCTTDKSRSMLYSPRSEEGTHPTILVVYRREPSTLSSVVPPFRRIRDPAVDCRIASVCQGRESSRVLRTLQRIAQVESAVVVVAKNLRCRWHGACHASAVPAPACRQALVTILIFCPASSMRYAGVTAKNTRREAGSVLVQCH